MTADFVLNNQLLILREEFSIKSYFYKWTKSAFMCMKVEHMEGMTRKG